MKLLSTLKQALQKYSSNPLARVILEWIARWLSNSPKFFKPLQYVLWFLQAITWVVTGLCELGLYCHETLNLVSDNAVLISGILLAMQAIAHAPVDNPKALYDGGEGPGNPKPTDPPPTKPPGS